MFLERGRKRETECVSRGDALNMHVHQFFFPHPPAAFTRPVSTEPQWAHAARELARLPARTRLVWGVCD